MESIRNIIQHTPHRKPTHPISGHRELLYSIRHSSIELLRMAVLIANSIILEVICERLFPGRIET